MSTVNLRPYQREASDAIIEAWKDSDSTLLVLPTGCGKTVVFADIIRRMQPTRAIVLAHREELIYQAKERIESTTGLQCEIEMADQTVQSNLFHRSDAPVVISTIQTQIAGRDGARMTKFSPGEFGVLIVDEAHHSTSDSYKRVIEHYAQNPALRILGVTATPDRTDEEALGQVFKTVAFDYEILDAIHDGFLVPIEQQMVFVKDLDFSAMRTTAGDLNGADLAAVMEAETNLQGIAGSTIEIAGARRTLVFTASVKQAEMLSEIFNRHRGGMSAWICGKTNKDDRRELLKKYNAGEIQIMVNCGCLTEGFDSPAVEVVVQARPTKSRSLYSQMVGRATRPLPGIVDGIETADDRKRAILESAKPSCLVVDFVGNSGRHKLMTTADILGGKVSDEAIARAEKIAKETGGPVDMAKLLDQSEEEIRAEAERRRLAEAVRRDRLVARVTYSTKTVNPFDVYDLQPERPRGWDTGKTLSEKQRGVLLKIGVDPGSLPYVQAKQLLNEQFRRWQNNLCTLKQAKLLKRHGYETKDLPMKEASALIDALAKNNWKRPEAKAA